MASAFRVRYHATGANIQGDRVVHQLPIRFGRNALNNCQIVHGYVSDFHAVVESIDGQLCVRDLGSKNGIHAQSGQRIEPNVPVPLASMNNTFFLGQLAQVHIEAFEENRAVGERLSTTRGSIIGNRLALMSGPQVPPPAGPAQAARDPWLANPASPHPVGAPYGVASLPPLTQPGGAPGDRGSGSSRPPPPWVGPGIAGANQGLPPLTPLPAGYGAGAGSAYNQHPGSYPPPAQAEAPRNTQQFAFSIETMALLGLRELAGSLVPGAQVQTTGDVARLLTKLHDTVEVFCRCFVPLREGYAQFVSSMDLRQAASQRSLNRSPSATRVDVARDPAAVAAALLDPRNQDFDAPEVVESIFADLMMHQLALVESVMQGVQALLQELSPERIEKLYEEERPPGVSALMGRNRGLWQTFKAHHEALANETRTFEVVFGRDFAEAYRRYRAQKKA